MIPGQLEASFLIFLSLGLIKQSNTQSGINLIVWRGLTLICLPSDFPDGNEGGLVLGITNKAEGGSVIKTHSFAIRDSSWLPFCYL